MPSLSSVEFLALVIFFFCREWGILRGFGIVYFESGIPFMYQVLKIIHTKLFVKRIMTVLMVTTMIPAGRPHLGKGFAALGEKCDRE